MQPDWTGLQSRTIDWLRFPMAVAVVMLHYSTTLMLDATGPLKWLCIIFQEGICRLAVPCFFFISGYLFFNQLQTWDWAVWKRKIRSRAKTLLLPYLLWNVIAFFACWLLARAQGDPVGLQEQFARNGGFRIFWGVGGGIPLGVRAVPIDGPLWFIRDLIVFTLLTPLIYQILKWTRLWGVLVLAVFFLFVPGYIPEGFVFFVTGAALQLEGKNILATLWDKRALLYAAALACWVAVCFLAASPYWGRLAKNLFLFSGIGAAFCGAATLLDRGKTRVVPFLAASSFFIFAAHEVLILPDVARPLVRAVLPEVGWWRPCLAYFVTPALAVALCLALLFVLQKVLPRTTALLTGSRKTRTAY